MADRDNGKVEHPLTLGPRHWEEEEGVCVCVRASACVCVGTHGTEVEGAGSRVGEGCLGREIHPMVCSGAHTHTLPHTH